MKITLSLIASNGLAPVKPIQLSFDQPEITLGRGLDNDFVIDDPDRVCSRKHAVCYLLNGDLYLEDVSSSFTLLNENERIERGHKRRLQSGDRIGLGDAVLRISLQAEPQRVATQAVKEGVFSIDDFFSGLGEDEFAEPGQVLVERANVPFSQDGDYLHNAGIEPEADFPEFDFSDMAGLSAPSISEEAEVVVEAPEAVVSQLRKLEVANMSGEMSSEMSGDSQAAVQMAVAQESEPVKAPVEVRPQISGSAPTPASAPHSQARNAASEAAIYAFIQGLGIKPSQLGDQDLVEIMGVAGGILNTLTSGVMSMLQARGAVKREFGMDTTQIAGQENNPLKFSISTEDALFKMLVGAQGYMGAEEAISEGVQDAKAHQIAVMSGMQAALVSLLTRFEPQMLEARLENKFVLSKKAKYWELYRDSYSQLVGEAEDSFHSLFGDEFSRVYAQQTREFKAD